MLTVHEGEKAALDRHIYQDHWLSSGDSTSSLPVPANTAEFIRTIGVGLAMFAVAWGSLSLIKHAGRVTPLWPANAVVLLCLLRSEARLWPGFLLSSLVGNWAADALAGDSLATAMELSLCNTLEIVVGACGLRHWVGRRIDLTRGRDLVIFGAVAGFIAPLLSATLATTWLGLPMGMALLRYFLTWLLADALGVVILIPALLALTSEAIRTLWAPGAVKRNILSLGVLAAVVAGVSAQSSYPLLFTILPGLLLVTFQMELAGAALGVLVTAAISVGFTLAGLGPTSVLHASPTVQIVALQIFLAVSVFAILPVAAALARARQLKTTLAASLEAAEAARAESIEAQRWARMAEQVAGVGYFRIATAGESTWSDEVYRIHGLDRENGPPLQASLDAVHPDDIGRITEGLRAARKEGHPFAGQYRVRRADGAWRTVSSRTVSEKDASGRVTAVIGTLLDITVYKQIEAAALESEARYRLLADKSSDIISRSDMQGLHTYVSPASLALLGYRPEELIGEDSAGFIHPDDCARTLEIFQRQVAERREHAVEPVRYRFRHKNGEWVWLEVHATLIMDAAGEPVEFIGVARDVTRAKAAEAELLAAREAAEAATLAKGEFLANMSHEIRTPLTSIMGFSSLLKEVDALPENARHYVQRISTAGQSLLSVVNDILDFSKLEAGQVELDPHAFDPAAFIHETAQLLAVQAANKGLDWRTEIDGALPDLIVADSARLRQVLLNLLGNAVKFTDKGAVLVRIGYEAAGRLKVSVIDTGVGIPAERRDRLFQRFSQVDGSVSRIHGGTGLGLAICKSLVELMGGEIGVQSEEGRGSTFWFTIEAPVARAAEVEPLDHVAAAGEAEESHPAHILIVDDLAVNRELVRAMLTPFGHSFEEAGNGAEAVRAALRRGFDLILMDLQMPGMDGFEAARMIRATAVLNRTTPIIALSANVLPAHVVASHAAGMDDHLGKPIVPAALAAKVALWAGATHQPAAFQEAVEAG